MTVAFPPRDETLRFTEALDAQYRDELGRAEVAGVHVDLEGLAVWQSEYLRLRVAGAGHEAAVQAVQRAVRQAAGIEPPPVPGAALRGRLRASGRLLVDASGAPYWAVWGSCLTALAPGRDVSALLRQYLALGISGVRVFAGALTWCGQTVERARAELPDFLALCAELGLYVEVVAVTDSASGYDIRQHVREVGLICAQHDHTILQIANEYWHPSQASQVHEPAYLRDLALLVPGRVPVALGAAEVDELPAPDADYPPTGGTADYATVHLARGIEPWFKEACRVREQEAISARHGIPVVNGEPSKTRTDPDYHFLLGACARGFGCPITVFHSESGLQGRELSENEAACAADLVAGYTVFGTDERLEYRGSRYPVKDAAWYEPDQGKACWRAYGFLRGQRGHVVFSGLPGEDWRAAGPAWTDGWAPVGVVATRPGVAVVEVQQS